MFSVRGSLQSQAATRCSREKSGSGARRSTSKFSTRKNPAKLRGRKIICEMVCEQTRPSRHKLVMSEQLTGWQAVPLELCEVAGRTTSPQQVCELAAGLSLVSLLRLI
jgi:hypothetical protein